MKPMPNQPVQTLDPVDDPNIKVMSKADFTQDPEKPNPLKDGIKDALKIKSKDGDPPAPAADPTPPDPAPAPPGTPPADLFKKADPPPADPSADPPVDPAVPAKDVEAFAALRKQNADLKALVKDMESKAGNEDQGVLISDLQAKLTAAQDQIGRLSLEKDPRFIAKYENPINLIITQAKSMLKDLDQDEAIADKAAVLPFKERMEYLMEQVPALGSNLVQMFTQVDMMKTQRNQELQDHEKISQHLQNQQQTQLNSLKGEYFMKAVDELIGEGHFALTEVPGQEDWNSTVQLVKKKAESLFTTDDIAQQTKTMIAGVAAPLYLKLYQDEREKREALEAAAEKTHAALPGLRANPSQPPAPKAVDKEKGLSPAEAASRIASRFSKK